jgi:hypothetical protein
MWKAIASTSARHEVTTLLGEPLAQPLLYVFLRECSLLPGIVQSMAHLIEHVEVVLDILERTI